ncbi:APC family permease [Stieleria varia]|uniref:Serine/threonine exchanger SteT n=1 Tax=Stieleria varia TaxID=2528005 RepID=A0A5C6ALU2_9BACT|nr:APC family permease [Stieleria varia]TWU00985.1 Serine/threonine exchanger SteT [Stieleria varia]
MESQASEQAETSDSQHDVQGDTQNDARLHRIGLPSAAAIVAASMIGAGVYTTSGFTIASLQSPGWVMVAWAVAGVIAICGALCYGALAKAFTDSGGEYLFLSKTVHPIAGLMAGWVSLLAGFTGPIAYAAKTFESYLSEAPWVGRLGLNAIVQRPGMTASVIVLCAAVFHSIGLRRGARIQDLVVLIKFLMIGLFLVIAFTAIGSWQGLQEADAGVLETSAASAEVATTDETENDAKTSTLAFVVMFANSLMWIALSYSGFNAAVYVAGEVDRPERNVPRALLLGTLLVTLVYLLLNAVFVYAPTRESIAGQPNVATIAAAAVSEAFPEDSQLGGGRLTEWVRLLIMCGLFTSVSALVMTGPRVYAKMAADGYLPRWMNFQGNVPVVSIWFQAVLGILVIQFTRLKSLLDYLSFTLAVSAALTASVVFVLHRRPDSPVKVPWYPLPPIVFVGGTLLSATFTGIDKPQSAIVALATLLLGALMYPWYLDRRSTADTNG